MSKKIKCKKCRKLLQDKNGKMLVSSIHGEKFWWWWRYWCELCYMKRFCVMINSCGLREKYHKIHGDSPENILIKGVQG